MGKHVPTATERPLVSYVLATYDRPAELEDAIDSILEQDYWPYEVIVAGSTSDRVTGLFENGRKFDEEWVTYHPFEERNGPAHAKNVGFRHAAGGIVVHIDDDATLASPDVTSNVVSILEADESVGVVAFQSRNHETGEIIRKEVPDPPDFETPPSEPYRTTFYTGVGTAFRRDVLDEVGYYPENFRYGFEEMDLSIRVLDAGYDIVYSPDAVVYHKKSPNARRPALETLELQIENRIRIAVRNLPWRYVLFSALVWSVYGLLRTRFRFASLGRIFRRMLSQRDDLLAERNVVDDSTIALLKSRSSQLFFWWYGPHPRRVLGSTGDLRRFFW